jgi:GGDEF domain-containing protein
VIEGMSYGAARRVVLALGLGVLFLLGGVMYLRRVDSTEVVATLFFVPVFLAFMFWNVAGGIVAALGATAGYALLRGPAIEVVGAGGFGSLIIGRGIGYIAFGVLGGWAVRQLGRSVEKLEIYDQIDDETGLFNARFLVQDIDLEMSRAARYKTLFSVCVVDLPTSSVSVLGRRRRARLLTELGHQLKAALRTVDRGVHAGDWTRHRFAVICPETGREGILVFADRLVQGLSEFLRSRGVPVDEAGLAHTTCTFPGDADSLAALRDEFIAIDRSQHPETAASVNG